MSKNLKKRIAIVIVLAIAVFGVIASCSAAQAAGMRHHHVKAKVCANQYKHWGSKKFKQCKRQGWFYERGSYPVTTETTPWTMANYILVYGPQGKVWVDTSGLYSVPNIR